MKKLNLEDLNKKSLTYLPIIKNSFIFAIGSYMGFILMLELLKLIAILRLSHGKVAQVVPLSTQEVIGNSML